MFNFALGELGSNNQRIKYFSVSLFFIIYVAIGLSIYTNYGISWDEWRERVSGIVSLNYIGDYFNFEIIQNDQFLHRYKEYKTPLEEYWQNAYGVAFQVPLTFFERRIGFSNTWEIFLFRHLINFLVFVAGVVALYSLAERRFSDWRIGLLGALFLISSPRLFAHSFYNSKDAVFMAFFVISVNSAIRYLLKPTNLNAVWHALMSALLIDIRIVGVIVPTATFSIAILRICRKDVPFLKSIISILLYSSLLILLVIFFWPYLWSDPYTNFFNAFERMADYPWKGSVLYFGNKISASDVPWHYIPVWISITTPLLYIALFVVGCGIIVNQIISNKTKIWCNDGEFQDVIFLTLFFAPTVAVIVSESVLYDGWRQMFFVYPMFILISLKAYNQILTWKPPSLQKSWITLVNILISICLINILIWMISAHPYQNVFFNKLAGNNVNSKFDVDYWGLSNRETLQYIADHDKSESISVWKASTINLRPAIVTLPRSDFSRFKEVKHEADADYIITNYRLNSKDYSREGNGYVKYFEIDIDGEPIISVFKR